MMARSLFLALLLVILVSAPASAGYGLLWESPVGQEFSIGGPQVPNDPDRLDMNGDGVGELCLRRNGFEPPWTFSFYDGTTYSLLWEYTIPFEVCYPFFNGFYDVDRDGIKEAFFDDDCSPGAVFAIDWSTDLIEWSVPAAWLHSVIDLDGDGTLELILNRNTGAPDAVCQVWGYSPTTAIDEGVARSVAVPDLAHLSVRTVGQEHILITYRLPRSASIRLDIYDVGGSLVANLFSGEQDQGEHRLTWRGGDAGSGNRAPSGLYFVRLWRDGLVSTRAFTVVR